MRAASGLGLWMEHGVLGICKLPVYTYLVHFCTTCSVQFFPVSERSAARSALYSCTAYNSNSSIMFGTPVLEGFPVKF